MQYDFTPLLLGLDGFLVPMIFPIVAQAIDTTTSVPTEVNGLIERAKLDVRLDGDRDEGIRYRLDLNDRTKKAKNALAEI